MAGIFINYRNGDNPFAPNLIDERLCREFGDDNVFLDSRSLRPGVRFPPELWGRLRASTVLLALIGPRWLELVDENGMRRIDHPDDYVRQEIQFALTQGHMTVIPVLLDDVPLPAANQLPNDIVALQECQYIRLRRRSSHVDLDHLIEELIRLVPRDRLPAHRAISDQPPPRSGNTVTIVGHTITMGDVTGGNRIGP